MITVTLYGNTGTEYKRLKEVEFDIDEPIREIVLKFQIDRVYFVRSHYPNPFLLYHTYPDFVFDYISGNPSELFRYEVRL